VSNWLMRMLFLAVVTISGPLAGCERERVPANPPQAKGTSGSDGVASARDGRAMLAAGRQPPSARVEVPVEPPRTLSEETRAMQQELRRLSLQEAIARQQSRDLADVLRQRAAAGAARANK
jgi:hypothetical protein